MIDLNPGAVTKITGEQKLSIQDVMGSDCPEDHMSFRHFEGKAIFHGYRPFPTVLGSLNSLYPQRRVLHVFKK